MAFLESLKRQRKVLADALVGWIPFSIAASDVTRAGAWCCLLGAGALLMNRPAWTLGFLVVALGLDVLDGVVARRNGEASPEVDWAADRFGEVVFIGPLFYGSLFYDAPRSVAFVYTAGYIANVFLPNRRIPVIALRHVLALYLLIAVLRG